MAEPEHDPYDDLYNDVPSAQEGKPYATPETKSQDLPKLKETPDGSNEASKADSKDASKADSKDTSKADSKDTSKGLGNDASKGGGKDNNGQNGAPAPKPRVIDDYPEKDPYEDLYEAEETADDAQDNFVEAKEPSELLMCLILASAYLGLAKYCLTPLLLAKDWKLLFNIEGFFLCIAVLAILIGLRPYLTPSALQISRHGIKYRGPYWPQRKTVNWTQVTTIYLSPELVVVLYRPAVNNDKKRPWMRTFPMVRLWPLIIPIVYLSDRERIAKTFIRHSPIPPVILSSPALISRIVVVLAFLIVIIWVLEMLIQ